jgi:hypothetical protein
MGHTQVAPSDLVEARPSVRQDAVAGDVPGRGQDRLAPVHETDREVDPSVPDAQDTAAGVPAAAAQGYAGVAETPLRTEATFEV